VPFRYLLNENQHHAKYKHTCAHYDPVTPMEQPATAFYSRGRTAQRVEYARHSPGTHAVSRASSGSSVRSMIDERLEWAYQDRMRSASRDRPVPESPFRKYSPFYAEFSGDSGPTLPDDACSWGYVLKRYIDTTFRDRGARMLQPHRHERKLLPRGPQSQALGRHIRDLDPDMSTYYWSCAVLDNPEDAICHLEPDLSVCAFCGMELPSSQSDDMFFEHLVHSHGFRKCNMAAKFFQEEHFLQHLKESHATISPSRCIDILRNRCFGNEQLDQRAVEIAAGISQPPCASRSSDFSKPAYQDFGRPRYMCECCLGAPERY
jgi:hypothetical protein